MLRKIKNTTAVLLSVLVLNLCVCSYYFVYKSKQTTGVENNKPICLFVDNVRSASWQSILYGTYQFAQKNQLSLISFDSFQQDTPANIDLCLNNNSHSIYGWHKQSDVLSKLKSADVNLTYVYQQYPVSLVASLLKDYLTAQQKSKKLRVALLLGGKDFSWYQALSAELKSVLEPKVADVVFSAFSEDLIANQSVALSGFLSKNIDVDYIIATDITAQLTSQHIKNNTRISSELISLSLSKSTVSAIKEGSIVAAIDHKLVKNTINYLAEFTQTSHNEKKSASPTVTLVTNKNIDTVKYEDSFVPYGYQVFYNHLYIKHE